MKIASLTIFFIFLAMVAIFFIWKSEKSPLESELAKEFAEELSPETPGDESLHPDTIPAMAAREFDGSDLKLVRVLDENAVYTRYSITYESEGFTVSGIMNIPHGDGPFPILILNHGYIDPEAYTNGQGLKREQDFFARHGYAVLHSDYRNHAFSDFDPQNDVRPRTGYVEDVLNAISALKKADLPSLDKENIGMLGHSMGGGIALNVMVTKPDTVKAFVLLAPIHSDYKVNFDKWVSPEWPEIAEEFYRQYGTYEEKPELWRDLSAKNFFSRVTAPVMLHQGVLDEDVPVEWSRELNALLQKEGKDITYYEYPNEPHTFINAQPIVMNRSLEFFDQHLKK